MAAFECFQAYLKAETPQLIIPSVVSFQLKKEAGVDQFCAEVFQGVARTLIQYRDYLKDFDTKGLNLPHLNAWLNSPIVQHFNSSGDLTAGLGVPGIASVAVRGGHSSSGQVNQSVGFAQGGFEAVVKAWLNEIFAVQGNGGVVCIIDNIELLETGVSARRTLEALRDKLFNVNGLRWVFCGANGVIHSLAASPRLTAFLNAPVIDVRNVHPSTIDALVKARLQEFSTDPDKAEDELPISLDDIKYLYRLVNYNLRDLLGLADEFCEFCMQNGKPVRVKEKKQEKFERWLDKATTERYQALSSRVSQNAWAVLDVAMSAMFKGTFGAADYSSFNQNSTIPFERSTFGRWLRELVRLGLLTKSLDDDQGEDDDGFNRDVFSVTAKGALVQYARLKKRENYSVAPAGEWMKRVHY
ncbi:hypothetical protein WM40_25075 [Robbsia andropogonis]|uniref:Uncharacterized protein n=1 Tax=Robbsia andropogonis TaxID=28092 RepID=A0A0F5JTE8_9BURK|nr:hypothetical protein WM40_25075 [Robbsia andropogonis]